MTTLILFAALIGRADKMPEVTIQSVVDSYGIKKQTMSDFLDMMAFIESGKKNVSQQGNTGSVHGEGYFQLETGSEQGGYTRLEKAAKAPAKGITPDWMWPAVHEARKNNRSFDMSTLDKDQQNIVMATYLMETSPEVIKQFEQMANQGDKQEVFLNYWVDEHWAGHKGDLQVREEKKQWAKDRMDGNARTWYGVPLPAYKRDKDWAGLMDMLGAEFNIT